MAGSGWLTVLVEIAMILTFAYVSWKFLHKEFGDRVNPDPKGWLERLKGE